MTVTQRSEDAIAPLAYYFGDDAYSLDMAVDAVARLLATDGQRPDRWRVPGASASTATIAERVATATLFGGGSLVVVEDPAPLIRGRDARAALERAIGLVAPGNGLVFIDLLEHLPTERRPLSADRLALATAIRTAGGDARQVDGPGTRLAGWIEARARERGIGLARGAAAELTRRVGGLAHGSDIDRRFMGRIAVGELEKLTLLHPDGGDVSAADVEALVAEAVPSSPWTFVDAVAERHLRPAIELLDGLLGTTPEPVLVALLHPRIRDLIVVTDLVTAGVSPTELSRTTKLSGYRLERLVAASRRWTVDELVRALDGLFELDVRIKGADGTLTTEAARRFAFVSWVADHVGGLSD